MAQSSLPSQFHEPIFYECFSATYYVAGWSQCKAVRTFSIDGLTCSIGHSLSPTVRGLNLKRLAPVIVVYIIRTRIIKSASGVYTAAKYEPNMNVLCVATLFLDDVIGLALFATAKCTSNMPYVSYIVLRVDSRRQINIYLLHLKLTYFNTLFIRNVLKSSTLIIFFLLVGIFHTAESSLMLSNLNVSEEQSDAPIYPFWEILLHAFSASAP